MPRFLLEGPRPCTIFCFELAHCVRTVHELRNLHVSIGFSITDFNYSNAHYVVMFISQTLVAPQAQNRRQI